MGWAGAAAVGGAGLFGYLSSREDTKQAGIDAGARKDIAWYDHLTRTEVAQTQADARVDVAEENGRTDRALAGINADMQTSIATERYETMLAVANLQYQQATMQLNMMDQADRRQAFLDRMALENRVDIMTLQVNAQIAENQSLHVERMTELQYNHEEKLKEYAVSSEEKNAVNVESLLV